MLTRRQLLAAAGALTANPAFAFGDPTLVDVAELILDSGTTSRPEAWRRMLYEVVQTTSVECEPRAVSLAPDDDQLFQHPFSVLIGTGKLGTVSDAAVEQLARYLSYGGFLLIDDTTGGSDGPLDSSVRRLLSRVFPTRPLSPLPADHSVFRAFFLLKRPEGRIAKVPYLEGITVGNLTPVIYMRNDLSGALDRTPQGANRYPCTPGGEGQRREAVKLAINLVMYSLTANYKLDQAHVRQLMLEGRLE